MDAKTFIDLLGSQYDGDNISPFISYLHFPVELYSLCALCLDISSLGFNISSSTFGERDKVHLFQLVVGSCDASYTFPFVKYLGKSALSHLYCGFCEFPAFEYLSGLPLGMEKPTDVVTPNFYMLTSASIRVLSFPNVTIVYTRTNTWNELQGYIAQRNGNAVIELLMESVEVIEDGCFLNSDILRLYAPNCRHIGSYAFYKCQELMHLDLPCCVEVGIRAFQGNISLRSVNLPALTLKKMGACAFVDCEKLRVIQVSDDSLAEAIKRMKSDRLLIV